MRYHTNVDAGEEDGKRKPSAAILSTHNGEGSFFNSLVAEGKAVRDGKLDPVRDGVPAWSLHTVTIDDGIREGLVECINESRGLNLDREQFRHECKALTRFSFDEEYLCIPAGDGEAWLTYPVLRACESVECPAIDAAEVEGELTERRFVGVDVGRKIDKTIVVILAVVGDVLTTRRILTLANTSLPEQCRIIDGLLEDRRIGRVAVDATGLGIGVGDHLLGRWGSYRALPVTLSQPRKVELAVGLRERVEDRRMRIPQDGDVREQLHRVRKRVSPAGNVIIEARRTDGDHGDLFWAYSLACFAASEDGGPISCMFGGDIPISLGGRGVPDRRGDRGIW